MTSSALQVKKTPGHLRGWARTPLTSRARRAPTGLQTAGAGGRPIGQRVADSENGDRIDDPSEDALFMLIDDLNGSNHTFVVIQPDERRPGLVHLCRRPGRRRL